jgi:S-(hydroxymethyl)glutathione dehydrogenase / alcohol dehydrogenase
MKAAVLDTKPGVLEIADVAIDRPRAREVLIHTVGSGLCHSDLHFIDMVLGDALGGLPLLLGHEASGIVEEVGADVTYVSPGDHVVTFPIQFCGACEYCLKGKPTLCMASPGARDPGAPPRLALGGNPVNQFVNLGGFAEQMLVHEHAMVKIDADYPLDRAALLGCAVATGVGAVLNTAQVRPGSTVAVIGVGGVGLAAIQGAVIAGARRIIAVDTQPAKFELATKLGATDCIDGSSVDAVAAIRDLTGGGVDYSFEAIGLKVTAEQAFGMLRPAGTATIIGVGMGVKLELDMGMFLQECRLQGSIMGSSRFRTDLPHLIDLDRGGRLDLDSMIERHIQLEEINDGYDAMRHQAVNGRRVIMFPT